jgi:hypothetical protein
MKIIIREYQDESYVNLLGAILMFSSIEQSAVLETITWDEMTRESFLLFTKKWKQVADAEAIDFNMEVSLTEVINEIEDTDRELISLVEDGGNEVINYPVDESQTISNAGDAVQYTYEGKRYEIITWNENADEHDPESKTISEMGD